jgi:hypothetical protein
LVNCWRTGVQLVMQGRLGEQGQRVRLLLGHGRNVLSRIIR